MDTTVQSIVKAKYSENHALKGITVRAEKKCLVRVEHMASRKC
jgi:hypothetical protein